jgi:Pyruvate/2-oxoacid:ferredoxin oxidoreductase gamma subunit
VGNRQAENLVLLGFALARGALFASPEQVMATLEELSKTPAILEANRKALTAGLEAA